MDYFTRTPTILQRSYYRWLFITFIHCIQRVFKHSICTISYIFDVYCGPICFTSTSNKILAMLNVFSIGRGFVQLAGNDDWLLFATTTKYQNLRVFTWTKVLFWRHNLLFVKNGLLNLSALFWSSIYTEEVPRCHLVLQHTRTSKEESHGKYEINLVVWLRNLSCGNHLRRKIVGQSVRIQYSLNVFRGKL